MSRTRRRRILLAASALLAPPFAAFAQASTKARVGYLDPTFKRPESGPGDFFSTRLRELGWTEGRNLTIERRYAEGRMERFSEIASEFAQLRVDVIVLWTNDATNAALRVTKSIPIVALNVTEPVRRGYAKTLTRPDGNVTGVLWADPSFYTRSLQLLKEAVPALQRVGSMFVDRGEEAAANRRADIEAAGQELRLSIVWLPVKSLEDIGLALSSARKQDVQALVVSYNGVLITAETQVREFAAANKLPDFYDVPDPVQRGGFMAYTPNLGDTLTRAASLVDKIVKGARPGDLPFEYPTRTRLVLNQRTAKERGITVPQSVLVRADRVIE